jgi:PAS domain S-box-containing protein
MVNLRLKPWQIYLCAILVTVATFALRHFLAGSIGAHPTLVIFAVPIMLSAYLGGLWPGLLATFLSCLGADYFLLPPVHNFWIDSPGMRWQLIFILLAGGFISVLSEALHRARQRADVATHKLQDANMTLALREAQLRFVTENARVGLVMINAERRYVFANAAYLEMLYRSLPPAPSDLIGQRLADVLAGTYEPQIRSHVDQAFAGEQVVCETHQQTRDGERHYDVRYEPMKVNGEVAFVILAIMDITARKQAEATKIRLAAIVECSADAIIGKDLNSIVTDWNAGAEKIFGYVASEMVGTSITRLIPADRQHEEKSILAKIRHGEKVEHFETLRQTKDGRKINVSITISPIKDSDGNIIGASKIARDITLQKQQERDLTRITRLYAALSQVNQAIVWMPTRDELLQKICEVLIEYGRFHLAWIGWHDAETQQLVPVALCGEDQDYIHSLKVYADDRPNGRGPAGLAFRLGEPYICHDMLNNPIMRPWLPELVRRGLNACAVFPIRLKKNVVGILTVYSDEPWFFQDKEVALLTEAAGDISFALDNFADKEARQQLEIVAESERLFSATMIEGMPGIVFFYDEQMRFLRWNRNFEVVSGYSPVEIAKMHPLDFFPKAEKEPVQQRISEVFEQGDSCIEASFVSKDGRATPYFFTGKRVVFKGHACLVAIGVDISERKCAEEALRVLNQTLELQVAERTSDLQAALVRAEAADRIKSAFLATMSHELRTPLNSIIGFTGIVLQGLAGPLNAEQTKQLGMVRNSSRHLLELINDVLDLSKIEAGQLEIHAEPFKLRDSLEHVMALVEPLANKKSLALSIVAPPDLGEITSDRRRVEQLLLNLVNNAIKFTEHGRVTVTAELVTDYQSSPEAASQPAVRLRVADTGMGIKPEDLAMLFQPFRQIDSGLSRQHEGTGLGLVICRRLATLLGGEISAKSEWSKGSEFNVIIPIQKPSAP